MAEQEKKTWKRYLFTAIVFTVLFIFPAIAWFALQAGLDHNRAAKSELKEDLGKVGTFQIKDQDNQLLSPQSIRGKVCVVQFLPSDPAQALPLADRIAKVYQSYDGVDDVAFLSIMPADSAKTLLETAKALGIKDPGQWHLLGTNGQDEWRQLAASVYKMPNPGSSVVLIDTSMTIRHYYDIHSNPEMGRLVEHIALLMPKQMRR